MSTQSAKLLVDVGENCACVKIIGRANITSSIDFKALLIQLLQNGVAHVTLDLTECLLMDSSFLGVLAGFGLKMNGTNGNGNGNSTHGLYLLNPNARVTELLENLGVLHLFRIKQGRTTECECEQVPANPSREEVTSTCLEAHRTLMEINPDNVTRFKDVAKFLAEDLKRLKSNP